MKLFIANDTLSTENVFSLVKYEVLAVISIPEAVRLTTSVFAGAIAVVRARMMNRSRDFLISEESMFRNV